LEGKRTVPLGVSAPPPVTLPQAFSALDYVITERALKALLPCVTASYRPQREWVAFGAVDLLAPEARIRRVVT
jgi:hypothetical protein